MRLVIVGIAFALSFFLSSNPVTADGIRIYAAASLTDVFSKISIAGEKNGLPRCACVHAASSALARQIASGAPADIFISANPDWMNFIVEQNLVRGASRGLAGNKLVLIAPTNSPFRFQWKEENDLQGVLGDGWLALADPDHVPAGRYAKAALRKLGFWSGIQSRIARTANVRAALALVARGEAAAGIVYASDVTSAANIRVAARIPTTSHPEIRYVAAIIARSNQRDVRAYFDFLASPEVASILSEHGFEPLR